FNFNSESTGSSATFGKFRGNVFSCAKAQTIEAPSPMTTIDLLKVDFISFAFYPSASANESFARNRDRLLQRICWFPISGNRRLICLAPDPSSKNLHLRDSCRGIRARVRHGDFDVP